MEGINVEEKKTSKILLNELLDRHYKSAEQAKERGELVAWATSIAPQELLTTMGIHTVYPENHAAATEHGFSKDFTVFFQLLFFFGLPILI